MTQDKLTKLSVEPTPGFKSAFYSGFSLCSIMDDSGSDTVLDQHPELHKTLGYSCLFSFPLAFLPFVLSVILTPFLTKSALRPLDTRAEQRGEEREEQMRDK